MAWNHAANADWMDSMVVKKGLYGQQRSFRLTLEEGVDTDVGWPLKAKGRRADFG
jgi:hypothetical protein